MRRVKILEDAAEEAIEAAAWYEQEHPGLGVEFGYAVNAVLDLLEDEVILLNKLVLCSRCQRDQKTRAQTVFPMILPYGNLPMKLS